jgi:adenosylhomocysteine nucleosidase
MSFVGVVTGLRAEAAMAAPLGRAAPGGGTPSGAAAAAARLIEAGAAGLVSFGFAGGLDPELPPGTLLVPRSVLHDGRSFPTDPRLAAALGAGLQAPLATAAAILDSPEAKRRLRAGSGAAAVDLESGAVAEQAARRGIPFAVLRAICDPAWRALPPVALIAMDQTGRLAPAAVLAALARHPGQIVGLAALALDAARARRALLRRVHEIGLLVA